MKLRPPIPAVLKRFVARRLEKRPEPLRRAAHNFWLEWKIARRSNVAARQFADLDGQQDLKLHLGCGTELKPGWVNIDLNPSLPSEFPGARFINYDLRLGALPLRDGSCAYIYSAHFFEHLDYQLGLRLMGDCYRILRPGGTFRAALPPFKSMVRAYVEGDPTYFDGYDIFDVLPDLERGSETLVDHVNYGVYQSGEHKCIYDEEKLLLVLTRMGFSTVNAVPYLEGIDPDNELRRRYSFYVEAIK